MSFDEALSFYCSDQVGNAIPSLHPCYVQLEAVRQGGQAVFLLYTERNDYWATFLVLKELPDYNGYFDIQNAYNYGGVLSNSNDGVFISKANDKLYDWFRRNRVVVSFFRVHPLSGIAAYRGYKYIKVKETIVVDLHQNFRKLYEGRVRTSIRKAESNGVTVEINAAEKYFMENFVPLYYEAMSDLNAHSDYYFTENYFKSLLHDCDVITALSKYQGKIIGGVIVLKGKNICEYHLSAVHKKYRGLQSVPHLLDHVMGYLHDEFNIKHFHLGGGVDPEDGLFKFKKGFSPVQLEYGYLYKICNESVYEEMKSKNPPSNNRIMFYRDEI